MQRHLQRLVPGWVGAVGTVGAFLVVSTLSGCPGTIDPTLAAMASGSGGNNQSGSGGNNSSGGSSGSSGGSSGSTGSGGSNASCTGNNDINYIMAGSGNGNACAQAGCHAPDMGNVKGVSLSGGLDLTLDSNIGSRLVGVFSGTSNNGSACSGNGNYLDANSNPPTGLLIKKIMANPPCGTRMPYPGISTLTATQISCVESWAEGLIMAAH
jgi:hypothetical protein